MSLPLAIQVEDSWGKLQRGNCRADRWYTTVLKGAQRIPQGEATAHIPREPRCESSCFMVSMQKQEKWEEKRL